MQNQNSEFVLLSRSEDVTPASVEMSTSRFRFCWGRGQRSLIRRTARCGPIPRSPLLDTTC
jgi:hypothetical protein